MIDNKLPWQGDEFDGQGGSFIYDPKTGKRTRVPAQAPEQPKPEPAVATGKKAKE